MTLVGRRLLLGRSLRLRRRLGRSGSLGASLGCILALGSGLAGRLLRRRGSLLALLGRLASGLLLFGRALALGGSFCGLCILGGGLLLLRGRTLLGQLGLLELVVCFLLLEVARLILLRLLLILLSLLGRQSLENTRHLL